MEKIYENIDKLCSLNQQCKDKACKLMHPRCLTGICIQHLQKKEHKNCEGLLQVNTLRVIKNELQSSINGVYLINLCPKCEECPNKAKCQFLHRDWVDEQKLCIDYIKDECLNKTCKRLHKSWDDLKKIVQQKYLFHNLDPDRLCFEKNCKCIYHHNSLIGFCLENFKGQCSTLGECPKIHVNWEEMKNIDKTQFQSKKVLPCTFQNRGEIVKTDTKFWTQLEILFNKNFLLKVKQSVKEKNVIDILFLMDCTGSMGSWIESAKNNILQIISSFQSSVPSILIRVAFIGYRDFCDKEKKIEYHDFTPDINSIKSFITNLKATGGGDAAEDIAGALELALKLDFSKHPESILCTYLICDSPTHGKQYHDMTSDDLLNKIPNGQLEDVMKKISQMKINNFFFCCKISESTQKMFKIMQSVFKDLEITECKSVAVFPDLVKFTLFSSYTKSQLKIQQPQNNQKIRIKASYVKHMPFKGIQKDQKGNTLNFMWNFLLQLGKNQLQGETVLEIDLQPFKCVKGQEGASSHIFKVFDIRQNRNLVAKLIKTQFESANQNNKVQKLIDEAERSVNIRYLQTMVAKLLASEFRNDTKKNLKAPPIFYPIPNINQTEINLDLLWEKISNNTNFLDQTKQVYATFSHYSYEQTNGQLLITDLQGKGCILSDPAIHTNSESLSEGLTDPTNSYIEGVEQFSAYQHKNCNQLCKSLNLTRQCFNSDLTDSETYEDQAGDMKNEKIIKLENIKLAKVNCVCDLCGEIFVLGYQEYQDHNQYYFHCEKCSEVNERKDICKCCGNEYIYNQAQTLRQGYQPLNCQQCQACKEEKNQCEYCDTKCVLREIRQISLGGVWKYLCKEGQQFFESIYCLECKESFCYQNWPTLEEYTGQKYVCFSCQKK